MLALAPPGVAAQRAPLSLTDARAQAAATHPELTAARAAAEAVVGRARQATLLEPPELDIELGTEGLFEGIEAGVTYVAPIRSSQKARAVRALIAADARLADLTVSLASATLDANVTRAFLHAALRTERIRLDQEDSAAVAALAANTRRRRTLELATDLDVLRLEAEEGAARRRLIADRGTLDVDMAQLSALLGRDLPEQQPLVFDRATLSRDTTALALSRLRGELVRAWARTGLERARSALALAQLSRWTDPKLGGGYSYQLGEHTLSAMVRVPLPARAGNRYAIRAAESELRAAELRVIAAERRVAAALRRTRAQRAAAAMQLELLNDDLERQRIAEGLARRRLEEGGPYLQIWLDIRRDRIALEREELDLLLRMATTGADSATEGDPVSGAGTVRLTELDLP